MSSQSQSPLERMGHHTARHTPAEAGVVEDLVAAFHASRVPVAQRLETFPRHVRRQDIARFLAKHEIFRLALPANGSIVECGVFAGGGLLAWHHFSAIWEPYNHTRRIIGFDTFTGFPAVHAQDAGSSEYLKPGAFATHDSIEEELRAIIAIHDRNRPLGHLPKIELVKGDAAQTIPEYVASNPHLLISLLYLDFDLYEPTKAALEHLYPRVVAGGVVAFDELNCPDFPGETIAFLERQEPRQAKLRRLPIDPYISYFVKGE